MSVNHRLVQATTAKVWEVLADPWLYPTWVVGASRMRTVDGSWPEVGARLHHSVGVWPALLDDTTEVVDCTPQTFLRLRARAWPAGEAGVTLRLEARGAATDVTIEEDAVKGPGLLVPSPLRNLPLAWRNVETLRRLAYVAENRR